MRLETSTHKPIRANEKEDALTQEKRQKSESKSEIKRDRGLVRISQTFP